MKPIRFPVEGPVSYSDTWGAARSGGRTHEGTDIMAPKMRPLLAAVNGTVTRVRYDNLSTGGNSVVITAADGWTYHYIHVNNDTPGTDDGRATRDQVFPPHVQVGATVRAGDVVGYAGDSGNAEATGSHLHFEIRQPAAPGTYQGVAVNPYPSLQQAAVSGRLPGQNEVALRRGDEVLLGGVPSGTTDPATLQIGQAGDRVLVGDWDGDGVDTLGLRRGNIFWLTNDRAGQGPFTSFGYGWATDTPIVGDWDGNGTDTIGVRRGNAYYLRNANTGGPAHITFGYGWAPTTPRSGDWDGNGTDTVGIRRGNAFYLRNANTGGAAHITFGYGWRTDTPIVGDWDGNGTDTVGIRRGTTFHLRNTNSGGPAHLTFELRRRRTTPLVGDWDGI